MIWGDFNLNLLNIDSNIIKQFKAVLNKYELSQMVKTYTYPSSSYSCIRKWLLNLFKVNDKKIIKSIKVKESISPKRDHLFLLTIIEIPKEKLNSETKLVLDISDKAINNFRNKINSYDWISSFNKISDIDSIYETFINQITNYINSSFKQKTISIKSYSLWSQKTYFYKK